MNLLHLHKKPRRIRWSPKRIIVMIASVVLAVCLFYIGYLGLYGYRAYQAARALKASVDRVQIYARDADVNNLAKELEYTQKGVFNLQWALGHLTVFSHVPYVGTQFNAANQLLDISGVLVNDAQKGMAIVQSVSQVLGTNKMESFKDVSEAQKGLMFEILQKNNTTITDIEKDLLTQTKALDSFDTTALSPVLADAVIKIKEPTGKFSDFLSAFTPFLQKGPSILGYPGQKTYLFLLQNNAEVRATGGFIGNYGILKLHNGEINEFHTDNIYNLDDPASRYLHVDPPAPFYQFFTTNRWWFLRDSNWSPDFSESAKKAIWFYHQEGGQEHIDGVIAITQEFIVPLLRFTGPIDVEGIVFTADNFEEELQYQVEKGYYQKGIAESARKEIIGELSDKILERLYKLPPSRFSDVFSTVQRLVQERQLLMYFDDPALQSYARNQNWTGEFRKTNSDFVMVVDSNMGALKTDLVMDKSIDYSIRQGADGDLYGKVDLYYTNNGSFTWFTTRYKDWVRIYVPAGSTLVHSEGALENDFTDKVGQVEAGTELDKTYFGAYIVVDPKSTKHFSIEYKLPSRIAEQIRAGRYELTAQKQSGVSSQRFKGTLRFPRPVVSYEPSGFFNTKIDANSIQFQSDLRVDRFFSVTF